MKISTKTQMIIMLIPIINFFCIFIWLYNYIFYPQKSAKIWFMSLFKILLYVLPVGIIAALFAKLWPGIIVIDILTKYIIPLLIGLSLVQYQSKLIR